MGPSPRAVLIVIFSPRYLMSIPMHAYSGRADLRAVQLLIQRQWRFTAFKHIGPLSWERCAHYGPAAHWPTMLWREGEEVLAYGWINERDPDTLAFEFDRARPDLREAVFDWFERTATSNRLAIPVRDNRPDLIAALTARGYVAAGDDEPFGLIHRHDLRALAPVRLPLGYRAFSMAEDFDLDKRVRAHRAAWDRISGREGEMLDPARVAQRQAQSRADFAALIETWPYRSDLDWVVEAPDGRWVASCILWYDEINGVGVFEPVGVDADERRRGFGAAVCLAALHQLRALGDREAQVGARGDAAYPVPRQVYQSIGFKPFARDLIFQRAAPR
jgi:GNAT superfamily N-acetyltransferase